MVTETAIEKALEDVERAAWWNPFRKSAETHQPYGDQNKFNVGEMSPKKAKLFEYLAKLDETEIEEIANNIAEYPNGASLKDGIIVNGHIEKAFRDIGELKQIVSVGLPAISKALVAILKSMNTPAGAAAELGVRKSFAGDLPGGKKSINPRLLMKRLQKGVSLGRISASDVSLVEHRLNNPDVPVGIGEQAQLARIIDIVEEIADNVHPLQ